MGNFQPKVGSYLLPNDTRPPRESWAASQSSPDIQRQFKDAGPGRACGIDKLSPMSRPCPSPEKSPNRAASISPLQRSIAAPSRPGRPVFAVKAPSSANSAASAMRAARARCSGVSFRENGHFRISDPSLLRRRSTANTISTLLREPRDFPLDRPQPLIGTCSKGILRNAKKGPNQDSRSVVSAISPHRRSVDRKPLVRGGVGAKAKRLAARQPVRALVASRHYEFTLGSLSAVFSPERRVGVFAGCFADAVWR